MGFLQDLRAEFSRQKATFHDSRPADFYKCRWWDVGLPLLIFRAAAAIFTITIIILQLAFSVSPGHLTVLTAYTIWTYIIVTVYFLIASLISLYRLCDGMGSNAGQSMHEFEVSAQDDEAQISKPQVAGVGSGPLTADETPLLTNHLPWYMKIQWVVYNIALPNAILVTIVYWSFLYPFSGRVTNFVDVSLHALNSVLMITEQYLGAIPTRLLHIYQPIAYSLVYMVFSVIVWSQTGLVLYRYILDWTTPITAGSMCGILLYFAVAQFVLFAIYNFQEKRRHRNDVEMH